MGCLARLGCLALLAVLALVAWFTRDTWEPKLRGVRGSAAGGGELAAAGSTWQPLTPEGATRARTALRRLESTSGPVFVNVAPGDLAAYIFQELSGALPTSADSIEAAAIDDRLYVRASVPTAALGDRKVLGPLALLLGDRERLQFGGTLRIIRPGLGEFRVRELSIRDLSLPQPLIPRILSQMSRTRPPEVANDALPLTTPQHIVDIRVMNGMVTMYKAVPGP